MSTSRFFNQVSHHLHQNRYKYAMLISVAAAVLVEAMKAARTIDTANTRIIDTPEGRAEVPDWRGAFDPITFDKDLSEDCADFAFYRDLCALSSGYKFSMKIDADFVWSSENNRMTLVETGKSAVCAVARFFASKMGVVDTNACNQLPDVGFQLK